MPNELQGSLDTLDERAQPMPEVAGRVILAGAERVVAAAKGPWPVKTGRSKEGLSAEPEPAGARIVDPAPYTLDIVSHGIRPWDAYVVEPMVALAAGPLLDEIGDAILAKLAEGVGGS